MWCGYLGSNNASHAKKEVENPSELRVRVQVTIAALQICERACFDAPNTTCSYSRISGKNPYDITTLEKLYAFFEEKHGGEEFIHI